MIGIAIVTGHRLNYLQITLDSLFRVDGIGDCYKLLFQLPQTPEERREKAWVLSQYPLNEIRDTAYRGRDVFFEAYRYLFSLGMERAIVTSDDIIHRPDLLEYIEGNRNRKAFLHSLSVLWPGSISQLAFEFFNLGFLIDREAFEEVDRWYRTGLYLGARTKHGNLLKDYETIHNFDTIMETYIMTHGALSSFPDKPYIAHIGLTGIYSYNDEVCLEYEKKLFTGPPNTWLRNAITLIESEETYPPEIERMLIPRTFRYGREI